MSTTVRAPLFAASVLAAASLTAPAQADEPVLLAVGADFAAPVTDPQASLFLPGGELSVALRRPFDPVLGFSVRGFAGVLFDGPPPRDQLRVDPGVGTWVGVGLGLRIRPDLDGPGPDRAAGLAFELEAGGVLTGDLVRPELSVQIGYGFDLGPLVLEARVRGMHVVHWDDPVDSGQAVVLTAGLGIVIGEVHAAPLVEEIALDAPDDDRDGDGILDPHDACVDIPEDFDGLADEDGCPEDDLDGDGVLDPVDACAEVPEDLDALADADGCPEDDVDADRILDPVDACPEVPEVVNGVEDEDGCPDTGLVTLEGDRIVLDERVLFETNRAHVRHAAFPILTAIAQLFLAHPEWERMRIEGHADERGTDEFNRHLSERRANQVRAMLVRFGVPEDRMVSLGYGESHPRSEDLAANRRVEFVMEEAPRMVPVSEVGGTP